MEACLPLGHILFLITIFTHLGIKNIHFRKRNFCPFLLYTRPESVVTFVWFSSSSTFSVGGRSGLQAGQSSTHTLYAYEATLLYIGQNEAWHCPAEIAMEFLGKDAILMVAHVSPKFHYKNLTVFVHKTNTSLHFCVIQTLNSVKWQWFSKVLLSPCGFIHYSSMMVSNTIPPEDSMITQT